MPFPPANSRYRLVPIMLTQAAGLLCGLASVRLNSHLIPPATLGFYGLFLTFAPIGMWVVNAGLLKFVGRHWAGSARKPELAREVLQAWWRRLPWLALLAVGAAWTMLRTGEIAPAVVALVGFVIAALLTLLALGQAALQAERAHWRDCGVATLGALLRSFFPPLAYGIFGGTLSLLLGFGVHALVAATLGWWAVLALAGPRTPAGAAAPREMNQVYEGPLFMTLAVSGWVVGSVNRWLVAWCYGDREAGYFTLVGGAAVIITSMLGTVILQYAQPVLFALGDAGEDQRAALARRCDWAALAYAGLSGLMLAAVRGLMPWLVGPLISPVYRDAIVWFVPAGCFGIAIITAAFYHVMLLAGRRERSCGWVDLTTAAVLVSGAVLSALAGPAWFARWMMAAPLLPWLLTRALARHYFFKPGANPAPAPVR